MDEEVSCEIQTQFLELNFCHTFNHLTTLVSEWELDVSIKFRILYAGLFPKMKVSPNYKWLEMGCTSVKCIQIQELILLPDIQTSNFVLQWNLHFSVKVNIMQH